MNCLVPNLSYGSFSGYVEVPAADYVVGVAGGASIADFVAPLSGLGGGSAVVLHQDFYLVVIQLLVYLQHLLMVPCK